MFDAIGQLFQSVIDFLEPILIPDWRALLDLLPLFLLIGVDDAVNRALIEALPGEPAPTSSPSPSPSSSSSSPPGSVPPSESAAPPGG